MSALNSLLSSSSDSLMFLNSQLNLQVKKNLVCHMADQVRTINLLFYYCIESCKTRYISSIQLKSNLVVS